MRRKPRIRAEEEWAKKVLERALQRPIVRNDDNSQPNMYDLRIGTAENPEAAIEVTGALNKTFTETWNIGPAKGPLILPIAGDWLIEIAPNANIKKIRTKLTQLLLYAEGHNLLKLHVDFWLKRSEVMLYDGFTALGITGAGCVRIQGTGNVNWLGSPPIEDTNTATETVSQWVSEFLCDKQRQDIVIKLRRSGAPKCHVFIPVDIYGVPHQVEYYLLHEAEDYLPPEAPNLPPPITDVWIVHLYAKLGLHWDGVSWERFNPHEVDL